MAFAAGRFEVEVAERRGRTFRMYHRETDAEKVARNREAVFDLHATALDWLEDYTAIEYPFGKFDFVLLPAFQYGGMEHPGAVFYRQGSLLLDESATQAAYLGRASLIAHETAHMWFGDLVTMRWFDDVWMKEVFANFMAARIVNPSFPDLDHGLRFLLAHHPSAYGVDRTPGANPIRQRLGNLREAGALYGPIIYQKAPIVMAHLERTVGPEAFREGLRRYLGRHAFGNATWGDLVEILDALHPDDLGAWSRVWVEEPGRPAIEVAWEASEGERGDLVLRQTDDWGRDRSWPQRLTVHAVWDGRSEWTTVEFDGTVARVVAWEGVPRPESVIPNAAGIEYGLFHLEASWVDRLATGLAEVEPALLRGSAILLLHDALLEERIEPERLLEALLDALAVEDDELLTDEMVDLVGSIFWRYLTPEAREVLAPEVEAALWARVQQARSRTLRSTLFAAWRRIVLTDEGVRQLRAFWEEEAEVPGVPLSTSDLTGIAASLALRGAGDVEGLLDRQRERISNPDRLARFDFVRPALSADPAVRDAFFQSLLEPEARGTEPWVLSGLGYLHDPSRQPAAVRYVAPALGELEEIQRTGDIFFPQRWLGASLGRYSRPEVWSTVDSFLSATPALPAPLRAKVEQEADAVRRAARIVYGSGAAPVWMIR
jgi:aminopeptidase N